MQRSLSSVLSSKYLRYFSSNGDNNGGLYSVADLDDYCIQNNIPLPIMEMNKVGKNRHFQQVYEACVHFEQPFTKTVRVEAISKRLAQHLAANKCKSLIDNYLLAVENKDNDTGSSSGSEKSQQVEAGNDNGPVLNSSRDDLISGQVIDPNVDYKQSVVARKSLANLESPSNGEIKKRARSKTIHGDNIFEQTNNYFDQIDGEKKSVETPEKKNLDESAEKSSTESEPKIETKVPDKDSPGRSSSVDEKEEEKKKLVEKSEEKDLDESAETSSTESEPKIETKVPEKDSPVRSSSFERAIDDLKSKNKKLKKNFTKMISNGMNHLKEISSN